MEDPEWNRTIMKAQAGDLRSFEQLVDAYSSFTYAVAYRFMQSKADAEDIAQEVFIRLWRNLAKYRPEVKLTTWLYKIIVNCCLDALKRVDYSSRRRSGALDESIPDCGSADDELIRTEFSALVRVSVEALTPKQKAVFILRDLEGLTVTEVCEVLEMTSEHVKSNLYYARRNIANLVREHYNEKTQHQ